MRKHRNKSKGDSEYEDKILDEYLAEKDTLDAARELEYGAGLSGVAEHADGLPGDDDYAFGFGENAQADLEFTKSAAAATAAAAAQAGLDMSAYVHGGDEKDAQSSWEDARIDQDELLMTASDEGLERFMRSIGFVDEEDGSSNAKRAKATSASGQGSTANSETGSESQADGANQADTPADPFGPAIGVKSPLDGKFDLRNGRVGNALGESDGHPLLDLDGDYSALPSPEVLAAYPAEVQRKIIEWTDRDVRARRDNESLRQDIMLREKIAQRKIIMFFSVLIVIVCIICAVATSILLRDAIYAVVFLLIPIIVVAAALVWLLGFGPIKK